jgi:hypothetical protein
LDHEFVLKHLINLYKVYFGGGQVTRLFALLFQALLAALLEDFQSVFRNEV